MTKTNMKRYSNKAKSLEEMDSDLVDVIWDMERYPNKTQELSTIFESLKRIEQGLDRIINKDSGINENEARFRA